MKPTVLLISLLIALAAIAATIASLGLLASASQQIAEGHVQVAWHRAAASAGMLIFSALATRLSTQSTAAAEAL